MTETYQMLVCGVGGQGILTITDVIVIAAQKKGLHILGSEVHGMAQKGGSVVTNLKIGKELNSPSNPIGTCKAIVSLEQNETLMYLKYLQPRGTVVTSKTILFPIIWKKDKKAAALAREKIEENFAKFEAEIFRIDAEKLAEEAGLSLTQNIVINSTTQGIRIEEDAENNSIKFNDFLYNNKDRISQASDIGFNNLFIFNYWNDWISPDINADGVVDDPYSIDSSEDNYDYYPLVHSNPPQSHLLLPPMILFPNGGESLNSTIILQWVGSIDSFDHPISYSIYLSKENGESWSLIASNITGTTFQWNITSSEYNSESGLIKVVASCCMQAIEDISDEFFTLNYPRENSGENLMR